MGKMVMMSRGSIVRTKNCVPHKIFSEQSDSTETIKDFNTCVKCLSKKLEFCIDDGTVQFIVSGVERIVDELVRHVLNMDDTQQLVEELKNEYGRQLFFNDIPCELLKVGSFYENTKNCFPDEFDFIFVILHARIPFTVKVNEIKNCISMYDNTLLKNIIALIGSEFENILTEIDACHRNENNIIELTNVEYPIDTYRNGPNITLVFRFQQYSCNTNPLNTTIHVDVTPAIKIIDTNYRIFLKLLPKVCPIEEFRREVKKTGSCLVVLNYDFEVTRVCFTETEFRFMTTVLSDKHREIYKLLKYIINGKLNGKLMKEICLHPALKRDCDCKHWISSYDLKCIMIVHHVSCKTDANMPAANCLLKILKWLQKRFYNYTENDDGMCEVYIDTIVSKFENDNNPKASTRLLQMEKRHFNQLHEELKKLINRLQRSDFSSICPLAEVHYAYLNRFCDEYEAKHGTIPIWREYHIPAVRVVYVDERKTKEKTFREPPIKSVSSLKRCQNVGKRIMNYIFHVSGRNVCILLSLLFLLLLFYF